MNSFFLLILIEVLLVAILGMIQVYFYRKVMAYISSRQRGGAYRIVARVIFGMFIVPLLILIGWQVRLSNVPDWIVLCIVFPLYIWHLSFLILFLVLMLGKILRLPLASAAWFLKRYQPVRNWLASERIRKYDSRRRAFLRQGVTILAGTALAGSTVGAFRRNEYELSTIAIPVSGLAEEFNGFTIALLSDIHSSVFMSKQTMLRYARATNELGADMIAVVGDFVNSQVDEVYPLAEAFSELKAPHGVFGVLGNHDYYSRDVDTVARNVNECGIKLLVNDRVTLQKQGKSLYLLGVDDIGSNVRAGQLFDRMLSGTDAKIPKILLCHRPYFFDQAAQRSIGLTLSGHTHGGQIVFARLGNDVISLARIASPYVAGLYTSGSSKMYVSRGVGTVGVPVRLNCPPEITRITLLKA